MVNFEAELVKIASRPDKTYDITINVPEYEIDSIRHLLPWVHDMVAVAVENLDTSNSTVRRYKRE